MLQLVLRLSCWSGQGRGTPILCVRLPFQIHHPFKIHYYPLGRRLSATTWSYTDGFRTPQLWAYPFATEGINGGSGAKWAQENGRLSAVVDHRSCASSNPSLKGCRTKVINIDSKVGAFPTFFHYRIWKFPLFSPTSIPLDNAGELRHCSVQFRVDSMHPAIQSQIRVRLYARVSKCPSSIVHRLLTKKDNESSFSFSFMFCNQNHPSMQPF